MRLFYVKATVHMVAVLPALWLFWQGWLLYDFQDHDLTANPVQYIHHFTGNWAIRFILLGLAITPLRRIFRQNKLIKFRRMIGLYAAFYVALHLMNFMVLDYFFDWPVILKEIIKRPAITLGMTGAILLLPLVVTSTRGWIRRLGRNWSRLHRLIYLIAVLAVIHNIMMVKADLVEPLTHAVILTALLGARLYGKYIS
ncbi:Protein-methionine-sulfoxide reductase heme-binding subunit MsrQ [hydrothermal vent metagenome]|uniref:Protein-methionine-sulfoxide reductase heme-binding subunit MsrQ n=1 Tax=hydrothermal vent metagenome TaxID=652676 RepID=A0A3B0RUX3_9ZZZZ